MTSEQLISEYKKVLQQLNISCTILARIQKCYPYIMQECTNREELDKLLGDEK